MRVDTSVEGFDRTSRLAACIARASAMYFRGAEFRQEGWNSLIASGCDALTS